MTFREFLSMSEDFKTGTRDYKKRRLGAVTGREKEARRGSGVAAAVMPANLSKPDISNPYGQKYQGMTIGGPEFSSVAKTHQPFKPKTYFQDPYRWSDLGSQKKS